MKPPRSVIWATVIAISAEGVLAFGLGLFSDGHDMIRDYVSSSAAVDAPLAGLGLLAAFVGASMHLVMVRAWWGASTGWTKAAAGGFAGFLVFIAVSALFQCDPGCAVETNEALIHTILGIMAFSSLGVGALLYLIGWIRSGFAGPAGPRVVAIFVVIADLLLLAGHVLKIYAGLVERLTVVAMWAWTLTLLSNWTSEPGASGKLATADP